MQEGEIHKLRQPELKCSVRWWDLGVRSNYEECWNGVFNGTEKLLLWVEQCFQRCS